MNDATRRNLRSLTVFAVRSTHRFIALSLALALTSGNLVPSHAAALVRRVNAPYFSGEIAFVETAIFWFGRVTTKENYADVRVGYNDQELYVHVAVLDRLLWYDPTPSPANLMDYDSIALYLNLTGNSGSLPTTTAFRFESQLSHEWETPRSDWQAAYRGNGTGWAATGSPFSTTTGLAWEDGNTGGLNNGQNNRGWFMTYHIPFSSLGLAGPPSRGSVWGLAVRVHDRDDATGTPITDQVWPEAINTDSPATWGQLAFGAPDYSPPPAVPGGTVVIRHKLNGATVTDGAVGGGVTCGEGLNYWTAWGQANYAGQTEVNVQNQANIADWPCFSKVYLTFPLSLIPTGKVIISATLTMRQFGNSGSGGAEPSYIQALLVGDDWSEKTLNWNNAPLALENLGGTWVDPISYPGPPGIARNFDVSRATAEAYLASKPLRLVLYSSDWSMDSGKYFWSSDVDDGMPVARPTLTVVWGEPPASIHKTAWPPTGSVGYPVTYTLDILGNGQAFTVTDDLPAQVSQPGPIQVTGGAASYNSAARRITWTGTFPPNRPLTLTFPVTVTAANPTAIRNTAILTDSGGNVSTAAHTLIANSLKLWLPSVLRK